MTRPFKIHEAIAMIITQCNIHNLGSHLHWYVGRSESMNRARIAALPFENIMILDAESDVFEYISQKISGVKLRGYKIKLEDNIKDTTKPQIIYMYACKFQKNSFLRFLGYQSKKKYKIVRSLN